MSRMSPMSRTLNRVSLAALVLAATLPAFGKATSPLDDFLAHDAALAALHADVQRNPADPCAWNEAGKALARRALFVEAEEAFERSVALKDDPIVWNNLGALHLSRGRYGPARSAFHKAVGLDPNYALAWYHLGAADEAELNFDDAVANYKRAFELDIRLADPLFNPAVVNNAYMVAIRTLMYKETIGALGMPLASTTCAAPEPPPAGAPAPEAAPPSEPH